MYEKGDFEKEAYTIKIGKTGTLACGEGACQKRVIYMTRDSHKSLAQEGLICERHLLM